MTRTAGAPIGCQRPSRFWGLGCPKIYHEAEDTLGFGTATWTYNVDDFVWSVGANANVSTCINIKAIRISYSANHHQPAKSTHKNFLHFYISFLR
ncbi:hypothetical protein [Thiolapillus sp.]|uniref:hypothetical protein n=1 Tax=Thiolapillus sp. TaxID=2017437 RepID=UPI003AF88BFD